MTKRNAYVGLSGITILAGVLAFAISGCSRPQPAYRHSVYRPKSPDERVKSRMLYPPKRATFSMEQLDEKLNRSDNQVTLLYIISPTAYYRIGDLTCLDKTFRQFYRYGLEVLVIDLHAETHWIKLKTLLSSINATLPAAGFLDKDVPSLINFLGPTHWKHHNLYLIAPTLPNPRRIDLNDCTTIRQDMREFLQKR